MVHCDGSINFWTLRAPEGTIRLMRATRFKPTKTAKGWQINIPAPLSPDGKRSRRFFRSREEAEGFASKARNQMVEQGTGTRILPPAQADCAIRAFALLGPEATPETLLEAVREYVGRHNTRLQSVTFEDAFQQFADLIAAAATALVPWLTICMFAGLRASEARQMVWGDFDFTEGFIRVRASVSKTRRPRAIPMEDNLRAWLLPYVKEDSSLIAPQGLNVLRSQLREAHKASGVRQIKHGPRHSYASYLLARDGSVDALLLNMGHEDAGTTFRHYHRVASERAAKSFWSVAPTQDESRKVVPMAKSA